MDYMTLVQTVKNSGAAEWLRTSVKVLPIINAIHVIGIALLFGTILIVDLRLVGVPSTMRSFGQTAREALWLTWVGFALALVTGALMFAANATTYVSNTAFITKMALLVLAGLNMAIFEVITARRSADWDTGPVPMAGRIAGTLSIILWLSVIFFGRWIGFTKGYDFEVPEGVELDFDFSVSLLRETLTAWA